VPFIFSKFVSEVAALYHELRKEGTSVPNPKFAILCSALRANFGFDKDTSKFMILVSFMDQKFARRTRGNDGANF